MHVGTGATDICVLTVGRCIQCIVSVDWVLTCCCACHVCPAGASGFVIEPKVAEEFRLPAFGDLSIAGIAGKVCVAFVCAGKHVCAHTFLDVRSAASAASTAGWPRSQSPSIN
jgi:hypothetical protein